MKTYTTSIEHKSTVLKVTTDVENTDSVIYDFLIEAYDILEDEIIQNNIFLSSLEPLEKPDDMHPMIEKMVYAASQVEVGPMASVAGAVAEYVGERLLEVGVKHVIVENGGDIYLKLQESAVVGLYAGKSPYTGKIGFQINPELTPYSVCTSASNVGPSINFGESDAAIAFSKNTCLADACATQISNLSGEYTPMEIAEILEEIKGLDGFILIVSDELAAFGNLPEIVSL